MTSPAANSSLRLYRGAGAEDSSFRIYGGGTAAAGGIVAAQ
jgi:hypothetical protein